MKTVYRCSQITAAHPRCKQRDMIRAAVFSISGVIQEEQVYLEESGERKYVSVDAEYSGGCPAPECSDKTKRILKKRAFFQIPSDIWSGVSDCSHELVLMLV